MRPLLLFLAACAPPLEDPTPYLDQPRILAVQSTPAEVEPGAPVQLQALTADADGLSTGSVDWAWCVARKPLDELGPVAPACLTPDDPSRVPLGSGPRVEATTPDEACSLFGPNPPPATEDEPAGRPVDPDVTGGFYQPSVLSSDTGEIALGATRLRCGLADVAQETYIAWNQGYTNNSNPTAAEFTLDGALLDPAAPLSAPAGATLPLALSWPDCSSSCGGAESYLRWDPDAQELITEREAMSVTWYTTGGTLAEARTGRASDDLDTAVATDWTAPTSPGLYTLIAVLRDDRGGVTWASGAVQVGD